jgi:hypothetical protein
MRVGHGAELGQGFVELPGLEEEIGELDLGFGEGGIEGDDLTKEREGFLLIIGEAVGLEHGFSVKRVGLAAVLGGFAQMAAAQTVLGIR